MRLDRHTLSPSGAGAPRPRLRAGLTALALVVAGLVPLALAGRAAGEAPGAPKIVGSLARFPADAGAAFGVGDLKKVTSATVDNGLALVYPKLDRLYQVYNF